jgi:hypothetical protein
VSEGLLLLLLLLLVPVRRPVCAWAVSRRHSPSTLLVLQPTVPCCCLLLSYNVTPCDR